MRDTASEPASDAAALRVMRPDRPAVALGLAVNHLMTKPAFASLRFGEWSGILVGQINRKHYYFVVDAGRRIRGFIGWGETTRAKAEAWVAGRAALSYEDCSGGNCIVFNAWAADNRQVNRFLLDVAREIMLGKEMVYFKRHYRNGATRSVRGRVNEFVAEHLKRRAQPGPV